MNNTRRDILRGSVAIAGLGVLGLPEWALPALAQGETRVPFTDLPANVNFAPAPDRRLVDIRKIDGPFTPRDQFYTTQHYGHPDVDPAAYPAEGLRTRRPADVAVARRAATDAARASSSPASSAPATGGPLQGLCGNGRWTGVPLRDGARPRRREERRRASSCSSAPITGEEEVEFRTQKFKVEQQFGRSLSRDKALSPEPFLAYALNGEPLTKHQGCAAASDRAGLVRRGERQVAVADPRAGGGSTSASTRRAGTARSRAR